MSLLAHLPKIQLKMEKGEDDVDTTTNITNAPQLFTVCLICVKSKLGSGGSRKSGPGFSRCVINCVKDKWRRYGLIVADENSVECPKTQICPVELRISAAAWTRECASSMREIMDDGDILVEGIFLEAGNSTQLFHGAV